MESNKPPVAWLGRKDKHVPHPEVLQVFVQVKLGVVVSHSERIYISYRQRGWEKLKHG